ncbi:uncharacterized protein TNIN_455971 [Trichonephila inaurata madagascariensis]|uniref:Uncharacterized protein n=1 Tax=Trichonephila inaurata madagascariensis TaxID=2747483 RepID=A0A8X7BXT1_9ARAC|nr:uncharacterized protein TNIN_455971 [Trichonephila inaurata madagascariensis]
MLSETWLDNDKRVSIPNFDCCVEFKRPGHRAAGVAIYRKQKNSHVVTPHMDITYRQNSGLGTKEEFLVWNVDEGVTETIKEEEGVTKNNILARRKYFETNR